MAYTHLTAPTRIIEVERDRFAYRRWGNASSGQPPLFFLQHFRGGMDHWDPVMTDGLAAGREVILYDYRGCASSTGVPRTLIEDMAAVFASIFDLGTGALAEFALVPEDAAALKPLNLDFVQAASIPMVGLTSW